MKARLDMKAMTGTEVHPAVEEMLQRGRTPEESLELMAVDDGELLERAVTPEPAPTGEGQPVVPELVALIRARQAMGLAKYGTVLRTRNGRDALVDALQESIDLNQYLMQRVMELTEEVNRER